MLSSIPRLLAASRMKSSPSEAMSSLRVRRRCMREVLLHDLGQRAAAIHAGSCVDVVVPVAPDLLLMVQEYRAGQRLLDASDRLDVHGDPHDRGSLGLAVAAEMALPLIR